MLSACHMVGMPCSAPLSGFCRETTSARFLPMNMREDMERDSQDHEPGKNRKTGQHSRIGQHSKRSIVGTHLPKEVNGLPYKLFDHCRLRQKHKLKQLRSIGPKWIHSSPFQTLIDYIRALPKLSDTHRLVHLSSLRTHLPRARVCLTHHKLCLWIIAPDGIMRRKR
jgi:hypothetical protein